MSNIEIHKGEHFTASTGLPIPSKIKAIVFDLDETLGHFSNLRELMAAIEEVMQRPLKHGEFVELFDLYPEFLRPGILTILEFLYYKKTQGALNKVYIYTNNQCGKEWVDRIVAYIHAKIGATKPLFDDTIYAFKIKNQVVDVRRTTNNKTHGDLIKCTMLKDDATEICFIDDKKYTRMYGDRVYYIQPRPYIHPLSKQDIIRRIIGRDTVATVFFKQYKDALHDVLDSALHTCHKDVKQNLTSDIEITKKIMYYVREYLYFHRGGAIVTDKRRTQKQRYHNFRKTVKKGAKPYQKM
jgi:hypothetical protein